MCKLISEYLKMFRCIILAIISPSVCDNYLKNNNDGTFPPNQINLIKDFRKTCVKTFLVTIACLVVGYLLAGLPKQISWNKLIPTFLIALPVYGARFAKMTIGGNGIGERMDKVFFETIYVICITWLAWDIFKGVI